MVINNEVFIHEDLSKPENRINWALFGLMTVAEFRNWFNRRLGFPPSAVLYPPMNVATDEGAGRPDFVVKEAHSNRTLGWIETELARDEAQMARFRRMFRERVIALWGRPGVGCDLSLQEICEVLRKTRSDNPQIEFNIAHCVQLIDEGVNGAVASSSKKASVGEEMWSSRFVVGLRDCLGSKLVRFVLGEGNMTPGRVRIDTTDTATTNRGFSVRVYSPYSSQARSVSVFNRSGGRPELGFSSKAWLEYYLRAHGSAIAELGELLASSIHADVERWAMEPMRMANGRPRGNSLTCVPLSVAEANVERIGAVISKLADRPAS